MPRHSVTREFRPCFILCFAVLVFLGPADATEPWEKPAFAAPAQKLLTAAQEIEAPDGAPVHMLLFETEYVLDETGVTRVRERQVYRVLSPAGAEGWSTVETDWSPWYQKRPKIHARVVTAEGRVHELDPATVGEAPGAVEDPSLFRDERVLRAPLPAVAPGSVVELEIVAERANPYFPAGETRRQWLAMAVPIHRARVILDAPADLELGFHSGLLQQPEPVVARSGGRVRRTFEQRSVPALESIAPGLPPEVPLAPYVAFSTGTSWSALARAYSELVDERLAGADLDDFAPDDGTAGSQWERIAVLLAAIHREVRYTGVQFGDAGIVPRTPAETLARRFGDCKDKAVLLTALLRREGVPAYLALLSAGFGPDVEPELPGLGLFNHAIVYVPGASPLWIDPTDPHTPLGSLPLADTGRWALVAASNSRGLIRTPEAESSDHRVLEVRKIHLPEIGEGRIVETSEMVGNPARDLRSSWEGASREELSDMLSGYVEDTYGATQLTLFEHSSLNDPTAPLTLRLEADHAAYVVSDLTEAVAILSVAGLFQRLPSAFTEDPETAADREHDFFLFEPHQVTWRYELHVPENLTLREMPESAEHTLGPLRYARHFETSGDGRRLLATFELDTGPRRYTPEDLDAVRRGLAELDELETGSVVIWLDQTVQAHLNAGRIRQALGEARRLVDLHPEEGLHRAQLAQALLAGGLGEEAREESRRAVELEPESTTAWLIRGWVLSHDEVGRYLVEGYDRQGAQLAYERMRELDPSLTQEVANLAVLLEHDTRGRRYSDEADLDEAIELYRSLRDDLSDTNMEANLPVALFWAERFEELEDELERQGNPAHLAFLGLVATAALEGPEAALREAATLGDRAARLEALAGAAKHLMLLRRYEAAASLYEAAGRLSTEPVGLLAMAETTRAAVRHENLEVGNASPEELIRSLLLVSVRDDGAEQLGPYLSTPLREIRESGWREDLLLELASGRTLLESLGLPLDPVLDLILADLVVRSEGDDATGYRVHARIALGSQSEDVTFYLVREEGEYRFAGMESFSEIAGHEVLRRLDAGDLEGAAHWLEWLLEDPYVPRPEDPLSGSVALRFWEPGDPLEEDALRYANATLMCRGPFRGRAIATLEEGLEAAGDETIPFDLALAYCHLGLPGREHAERVRHLALRLLEAEPGSDAALLLAMSTARALGRVDEIEPWLHRRLEADPQDMVARKNLGELAQAEGRLDQALAISEALIAEGEADANVFNEAAWIALVRGSVDEQALAWAREGVERSLSQNYSYLHTLAAVLAELERPTEAYSVLLQALSVTDQGKPTSPDWLVLGRLAELYDLPEAAAKYYGRVEKPELEPNLAMSSWTFAQQRLAQLDELPEGAAAAGR